MSQATQTVPRKKRIALIAHDARKQDLLEWVQSNKESLQRHVLFGTGTTATLLQTMVDLPVTALRSGPLGGDQQIGAKIVDGEIDVLVFFWDPLASHPHDPDVRALLRVAVLQNIPVATNRASADFIFSSPLISGTYERYVYDYATRLARERRIESGLSPDRPD